MKPATPEAYRLLHDGCIVLSQIEANGMRIDVDYLDKALVDVGSKINDAETVLRDDRVYAKWRKRFGTKTNLGSRQQLAAVMFEQLGYSPKPKEDDDSGERYKADESAFDHIEEPFIKQWLQWQKLQKVKGTYLEGIRREVVDGFLHAVFNLHLVRTYRSSADSPNFQNIPVRNPEYAEIIRRCFIPRDGRRIVEIDFTGAEVRCAACYNHDPVLIEYIKDPTKDMHRDMAAQLYCIDADHDYWGSKAGRLVRYFAKNQFVFPQFYGSYFGDCAVNLWAAIGRHKLQTAAGYSLYDHLREKGIDRVGSKQSNWENGQIATERGSFMEHVRDVEADFWGNRFRVYAQWKKDWFARYQRKGGFSTLTGFTIEGVYKRNDVVNYPIQGSAFHWLLWSLIELQRAIERRSMKTLIVGQIHDSIVADVPEHEVDQFVALALKIITKRLPAHWDWIIVPVEVEVEMAPVGASWFEKKKV